MATIKRIDIKSARIKKLLLLYYLSFLSKLLLLYWFFHSSSFFFFLGLNSNSTPRLSSLLKVKASLGKIGKLDISVFKHIRHFSVGNLDLSKHVGHTNNMFHKE
jgi:hypothetical protein